MNTHRSFYRARLVRAAYLRRLRSQSHARFGDLVFAGIVLFLIIGWAVYTQVYIHPFGKTQTTVQAKDIDKNDKNIVLTPELLATPTPAPSPKPITDSRAKTLYTFLIKEGSPLADYAQTIVEEADAWDIGWTKLVSISKIESSYGTTCPQESHNAWGIGKPFEYYESWEAGIKRASKLIGEHYKTNEYAGIKAKYCPSSDGCNPKWAAIATDTSNEILELAKAQ